MRFFVLIMLLNVATIFGASTPQDTSTSKASMVFGSDSPTKHTTTVAELSAQLPLTKNGRRITQAFSNKQPSEVLNYAYGQRAGTQDSRGATAAERLRATLEARKAKADNPTT